MWLRNIFPAKKRIYLDYASATPVLSEAARAVSRAAEQFGNPGSIHSEGVVAKASLNGAREKIASLLSCKAREVVFVSGGTEANNLAILGTARARMYQIGQGDALANTHWVVSSIEHPSVLECFAEVERLGGDVTFVDPDARGVILPETVARAVRENTVLISIGWANHEIGVVQPIRDIVRAVRAINENVCVHVDAGQAPLYLSPQVHTLDVDLFSIDSGKLYGPRGIGALYVSHRAKIARTMLGGSQERGLRAGTENVALATGFAAAFEQIQSERESERKRLQSLRDTFAKNLATRVTGLVVNTDTQRSLPHMFNVSIPNIQSEYATLALDSVGIAVATKSACREGEEGSSHVVAMLGETPPAGGWRAQNTLRFSLGRATTGRDLNRVVTALVDILSHTKR